MNSRNSIKYDEAFLEKNVFLVCFFETEVRLTPYEADIFFVCLVYTIKSPFQLKNNMGWSQGTPDNSKLVVEV